MPDDLTTRLLAEIERREGRLAPPCRPLIAPWADVRAANRESHRCDYSTRQKRNEGL